MNILKLLRGNALLLRLENKGKGRVCLRLGTFFLTVCMLVLTGLSLGVDVSRAADSETEDEHYWVASLDVSFEIFALEGQGSVTNLIPTPAPPVSPDGPSSVPAPALWGIDNDSGSVDQLIIQIGADFVASQAVPLLPGKPRPFFGVGIGLPTETGKEAVSSGDARNTVYPESYTAGYLRSLRGLLEPGGSGCPRRFGCLPPNEFEFSRGQGSLIDLKIEDPTWSAQAGLQFSLPVLDRVAIEFRPGVSYRGQKLKVSGFLTTQSIQPNPDLPYGPPRELKPGGNPNNQDDYNDLWILVPGGWFDKKQDPGTSSQNDFGAVPEISTYRSQANSGSVTQHFLGPNFELGVSFFRSGRGLKLGLYVDAAYLWLVNRETLTFSDSQGIASYSYTPERGEFRGSIGLRFGWAL